MSIKVGDLVRTITGNFEGVVIKVKEYRSGVEIDVDGAGLSAPKDYVVKVEKTIARIPPLLQSDHNWTLDPVVVAEQLRKRNCLIPPKK